MQITLEQLRAVAPQTSSLRLAAVLPGLNAALPRAELSTPTRVAMFLGQTFVESQGFMRLEENLNYGTPERIAAVFKRCFASPADALPFVRNAQALGNKVYADILGNGDEQSGDGFKFRGRGLIDVTGFSSYLRLSKETGTDYTSRPDLLATPEHAAISAAHFWTWKWINLAADKGDVEQVTKLVAGPGMIALDQRREAFERGLAAFA